MPSNPPLKLSGPLGWAIAGVAAAALFGAGMLAARALFDDDAEAPPAAGAPVATRPPAQGAAPGTRPGIPVATAPGRGGEDSVAPRGGPYAGPYGCVAPLPAAAFGASSLDLAAAGVAPRVPRSGFELTSVYLSAIADCTLDGTPTGSPRPSLSTSWRHTATGLEVYISQTASSEPAAPVLRSDGATFSALGYLFAVYVNAYPVMPVDTGTTAYPVKPDPRAADVLREVIAQMVPGFNQQCFWVVVDGDWASLAASGIGDPRPAIPGRFKLAEVHITTFRQPAPPCDVAIRPTEGLGLYAQWKAPGGESLGVSVTGLPAGATVDYPGYLDQYGANWTANGLQFSIWYGSKDGPGSADLVRAVARALDPSFTDACFIQQRTLAEADLAKLGLRPPTPPAGYAITSKNLTVSDIAPGCPRPKDFFASYALFWTLEKGADIIDVSVYAAPDAPKPGSFSGWISDSSISWMTADGKSFNVSGYSKGVSPVVSRDDLIAVAKSLDPSLDISKLEEQPGGGVVPPRPAPGGPERGN